MQGDGNQRVYVIEKSAVQQFVRVNFPLGETTLFPSVVFDVVYELPGVARRGEKEKCRTFFNGNFSEKKLCHRAERVEVITGAR